MTATEKYKRAEALFNDRTKRELADMVVHREGDLEDAKAESEHMRLKALAVAGELQEENERLKAENAKLRELVRKVLQFERAGCEGCPYASTCDADCLYDPDCPMREDIERDMRELGVEVDG